MPAPYYLPGLPPVGYELMGWVAISGSPDCKVMAGDVITLHTGAPIEAIGIWLNSRMVLSKVHEGALLGNLFMSWDHPHMRLWRRKGLEFKREYKPSIFAEPVPLP